MGSLFGLVSVSMIITLVEGGTFLDQSSGVACYWISIKTFTTLSNDIYNNLQGAAFAPTCDSYFISLALQKIILET